jgi:hypothetical protein
MVLARNTDGKLRRLFDELLGRHEEDFDGVGPKTLPVARELLKF